MWGVAEIGYDNPSILNNKMELTPWPKIKSCRPQRRVPPSFSEASSQSRHKQPPHCPRRRVGHFIVPTHKKQLLYWFVYDDEGRTCGQPSVTTTSSRTDFSIIWIDERGLFSNCWWWVRFVLPSPKLRKIILTCFALREQLLCHCALSHSPFGSYRICRVPMSAIVSRIYVSIDDVNDRNPLPFALQKIS